MPRRLQGSKKGNNDSPFQKVMCFWVVWINFDVLFWVVWVNFGSLIRMCIRHLTTRIKNFLQSERVNKSPEETEEGRYCIITI